MMKNYVIVSHNTNERYAQYYKGMINGSYLFTADINDALRFEIDELSDIIVKNSSLTFLGVSIVRIEDCTFDKLKTDKELQRKYADFLYVAR